MDFRIIKSLAKSKWATKYDDEQFYQVQYRADPSWRNLWHPTWKNVTYNEEEYMRYRSITELELKTHWYSSCYAIGNKVPGYKNACNLLGQFKDHCKIAATSSDDARTVYFESTNHDSQQTQANVLAVADQYDKLLDNDSTNDDEVQPVVKQKPKRTKRGRS